MGTIGRKLGALAAVLFSGLMAAPIAQGFVYWGNNGGAGSVARANLDGTGVNQSFIASAADGVAVDRSHIYMANSGQCAIGRANLDGSGVNNDFITGLANSCPIQVEVDGSHIYWSGNGPSGGVVGRANLDGSRVNQTFITNATSIFGVAVDSSHVYWTDFVDGTIGRANLDGSSANQSFITGASSPVGVTVNGANVFWTNNGTGDIGRAGLDGSSPNQSFITGGSGPYGVAADGAHVYWANNTSSKIGRANLDGTGANQSFITGANQPGGVTVNADVTPTQTSTTVSCVPGQVTVGRAATCTAKVSDNPLGGADPTGSVTFSSDSSGSFDSGGTCALAPTGNPGQASCQVGYTPTAVGSSTHTITASYSGDGSHDASGGSGTVTVTGGGGGPFTLTVHQSGTGFGTVISTPAGILCGAVCTGSFATGASVTLNAAANMGSTFVGFSGDCSGSTCTVQMTANRNVTVTFTGSASPISTPFSSPPQNIQLPSIVPSQSCQFFGRSFCRTIPYQYSCDPGQWIRNDPATPYQFEWQQLYYIRQGNLLVSPFWRPEPQGASQTFFATDHTSAFDIAHSYVASGAFRCVVTASGPGGSAVAYSAATRLQVAPPLPRGIAPPPRPVNIIVTGIEVTQAVQSSGCGGCSGTLPSRDQLDSNTPGVATYQGVTLAAGKFTVVRVFAHFLAGSTPTLTGATAQLEVLDSNGSHISVLPADSSPAALTPPPCWFCVRADERANPGSSFNFLVPWQETYHRSLTFRATVTPAAGLLKPGQCGGCLGNTFTLNSVPFVPTATIPIHPIPLTIGGTSGPCGTPLALRCTRLSPDQVFADAETMMPFHFQIFPYRAPLAVDGTKNSCNAAASVSIQGAADNLGAGDYGVGVFTSSAGQVQNGCTLGGYTLFNNGAASAVLDTGRSITSVMHELGHGLSLPHADTGTLSNACPPFPLHADNCGPHAIDGTADCGGNSKGQTGETWPPGSGSDNEGRLGSVGLDRRAWDIFRTGSLPSTFVEGFDHQGKASPGAEYYDFMSYCGDKSSFPASFEADHWISIFNWNRLIAYHPPAQTLPPAADQSGQPGQGTPLRVIAIIDSDGNATVVSVSPGERTLGAPTPGSPYRIELRDAAGAVLDSVAATTGEMHVDFTGKRPEVLLDATLPFAPATAAVVVTAGARELAGRTRSAHSPTARFVSPRVGARLGRGQTTVVRWSAHDADGDALTSTVEYSADGGRHWTVVAGPLTGSSASVPSRFLSASQNARLRVQISDGFNLTSVTSGRLHARGVAPVVQILNASRRGHVLATTVLLLEGSAFDDADQPLTGRRLKWYLGRRLIGTGEQVTARNLQAGSTAIRLLATDSHGRTSQASLPLRVSAVPVRYRLFDAPFVVSTRARTVEILVAASEPAAFTIAGRRYAVGTRPRTITVPIGRGGSPLRISCTLRSPDGVIRGTYIAIRR
jgi:virginiamycin B lyase